MARVIGHGMTRKSTEKESKGMARVGFTTKTRMFFGDGVRRI
jgi:hypothetical protein